MNPEFLLEIAKTADEIMRHIEQETGFDTRVNMDVTMWVDGCAYDVTVKAFTSAESVEELDEKVRRFLAAVRRYGITCLEKKMSSWFREVAYKGKHPGLPIRVRLEVSIPTDELYAEVAARRFGCKKLKKTVEFSQVRHVSYVCELGR